MGTGRDTPAQVLGKKEALSYSQYALNRTFTGSPGCKVPQALTVGVPWTQHKDSVLPRHQPEGQGEVPGHGRGPTFLSVLHRSNFLWGVYRALANPAPEGGRAQGGLSNQPQVLSGGGGQRKGVGEASSQAGGKGAGKEGPPADR